MMPEQDNRPRIKEEEQALSDSERGEENELAAQNELGYELSYNVMLQVLFTQYTVADFFAVFAYDVGAVSASSCLLRGGVLVITTLRHTKRSRSNAPC